MPDYLFMLDSRLSAEQRAVLIRMQELAVALEMNVYLAGGAVRDLVSGMPIRDLDFTVEGNPSRFARELEKPNASDPGTAAAHIVEEDERRRHVELVFPGEVDASISASHDEVYDHPGAKPEIHWSPIMNDLRRRDFSMNAVAISLNAGSRGLLLDPTNGLAELERREIRAMTNHSFTNQPVRLLRVIRFCERLGFKMDPRTQEWYERAIER
ncbi:MAG: CCA tRNA nucleotidyltransferase, partial [Acidobacteria bacterium]|nr:CCA tRNA nucleotidyltransferase [Acidobacteriota bacterium]